ncbi:hypothetical protein ABB37_04214 [Leptomonas pyrrhocoris]|uniref:Uncharacterized protein n=1 Tax=Leptomonas pyrrhocoris TaxID=157538 RepID=A0A0N0DVR8_LEPPY|nr:hypothetical protein ABB37_04214 [Leptomonas pyrrhocoris]KPA80761.1 hypothetical protein ABB37_04214 [Leptomonas pyrrhocoris]|eukprot:XP_015659200.1 hypothetical protein ABB37_04214 [Leptomonas pyrrhocoris]
MPRIQSRLHADELLSTRQALAKAGDVNAALQQRVEQQQKILDDAEAQNKGLRAQLAQAHEEAQAAHAMLSEVQAHSDERERRLREQLQRMTQDVHTLEEMVQAARRREAAHAHAPGEESAQRQRAETGEVQADGESSHDVAARSSCPPCVACEAPPDVPKSLALSALPAPSARSFYWQEQLLSTAQQATASFDVVRRHTHDLCQALGSSTPNREMDSLKAAPTSTSTGAGQDLAERWRRQLQHLQSTVDEVVQADARLISFLVLVAGQQSKEIARLHQQWSEAQLTIHEVEEVLDAAQTRVYEREQEVAMLRGECAALSDARLRYEAQVNTQLGELQANRAAVHAVEEEHQKYVETHSRQVEALTVRLAQSTRLHQQATSYAHKLEAALQEKQHLLESAVAARNERQRQEVLTAAEAQVEQFVTQLSQSAQQLQSSLVHLCSAAPASPTAPTSAAPCASFSVPPPKTALSVSSPSPSPPGLRSAAGVLSSSTRVGTRSPSSVPYDDSIFLADLTLPFSFDG